jgi:glycosyltransferase involved in cell wall biosynthesis
MKILLYDKSDISTGSTRIHIHNIYHWLLNLGYDVCLNNIEKIEQYDAVIFGKNTALDEVKRIRRNSKILIGFVNPSDYDLKKKEIFKYSDFFIVGSIIERDYYLKYSDDIFVFPQIERLYSRLKVHTDHETVIIGYHGNMEHLKNFNPYLSKALEKLSKEIRIKLLVCYDKKTLGKWKYGRPRIDIEEVQWDINTIEDNLIRCDIGVCPGLVNISGILKNIFFFINNLLDHNRDLYKNDYLIRFKNTANSGRSFVFHQLGIPVVGDISPSNFHILATSNCGFLAYNIESWYLSLKELCNSSEHRKKIAENALKEFTRLYDPNKYAIELYTRIENLFRDKKSQ